MTHEPNWSNFKVLTPLEDQNIEDRIKKLKLQKLKFKDAFSNS